MKKTENLTKKM